jgi:hypothetical protein
MAQLPLNYLRFDGDVHKHRITVSSLRVSHVEFKSKLTGIRHQRSQKAGFGRIGVKKGHFASADLRPIILEGATFRIVTP